MLNSMTGFGGVESKLKPAGKISVEIRSTNHKFLEIVLHVPEGFMSLEDKIKKEIETKLKRGRVVCSVNINGAQSDEVFINKKLLKKYVSAVKNIQAEFSLKNGVSVDALIKLPGVLALEEKNIEKAVIWPQIKGLLLKALEDLTIMRR
ncbi:MAG: hypothetical protein FJZ15_03455, partial [Candidatus Omnitrophica bacterium]|nr:hypothetical protein [Candidatus Omnitrophota bacterium]